MMKKKPVRKKSARKVLPSSLDEDKKLVDYDELDRQWRTLGLSGPACRALVDAKLYRISDLRKISLADLEALHGMSKSAIARLKTVMAGKKISFRLK